MLCIIFIPTWANIFYFIYKNILVITSHCYFIFTEYNMCHYHVYDYDLLLPSYSYIYGVNKFNVKMVVYDMFWYNDIT